MRPRATSASGLYVPISPVRMVDTRNPFARPAAEGAVTRMRVNLPPLPATGVAAAMLNVTATQAAGVGYVTIYPAGGALPNASNLNLDYANQTIPNAVIATLGNGSFDAFTFAGTHLIVDAFGYFRALMARHGRRFASAEPRGAPRRWRFPRRLQP